MTTEPEVRRTLSESAARQLANATKTRPQWSGITPRWLVSFLPWVPVEAGIYRLNRVREDTALTDADVQCSPARDRDADLPETFVDYEDTPREYSMNAVTTVLDVQTRVSDLYNHPYDQIQEQLRLLTEKVKEKQEAERKRVEAQGIADYQRIISTGLSDKQLQYESIKANLELAKSPNAKIIVLGKGNNPMIIDGK